MFAYQSNSQGKQLDLVSGITHAVHNLWCTNYAFTFFFL